MTDNENAALRTEIERLRKLCDEWEQAAGSRGFRMAEEIVHLESARQAERDVAEEIARCGKAAYQLLREAPIRHEKGCAIVVTHRVNGVQQPCDCGVDAWRESVRVVLEEGKVPVGYSISLPPEEALRVFLVNPTTENAITLARIFGIRKPT